MNDLTKVDMGYYNKLVADSGPDQEKFGLLPLIAMCLVGTCLSSSFCERIISAANQDLVMNCERTCLHESILEMLAVLRINRSFMEYMKENHPSVVMKFQAKQVKKLEEMLLSQ